MVMSSQPFSDPFVQQIPAKPPIEEPTQPIDHVLHSEVPSACGQTRQVW